MMRLSFWEHKETPEATELRAEVVKLREDLDRLVDHVNREVGVAGEVPLHSRIDQLDKDDAEMEKSLTERIEGVRKLAVAGSIKPGQEAEGEVISAGRPLFSQRRATAIARGSNAQAMMDRIAKASPPPRAEEPEQKEN